MIVIHQEQVFAAESVQAMAPQSWQIDSIKLSASTSPVMEKQRAQSRILSRDLEARIFR